MSKTKPMTSAWGRAALYALLLICLLAAASLICMAVMECADRKQGEEYYTRLAASMAPQSIMSVHMDSASPLPTAFLHQTSAPVEQYLGAQESRMPTAPADYAFAIDFDDIHKTCPDVVGWIRLEDSAIDYPIVHGRDNEFYLHHLPDRTPNRAGAIMMDAANSSHFGDDVTILHGHHMKSGAMFGRLADYGREDYYQAHQVMQLYTPTGHFDVLIFAALTVNGYTFDYPTSFADESAFECFVEQARAATPYETNVSLQYGDRILLLSTCAYAYAGARSVVMGKIVESEGDYVMF